MIINRIINMILHQVIRSLVNTGMRSAMNLFTRIRRKPKPQVEQIEQVASTPIAEQVVKVAPTPIVETQAIKTVEDQTIERTNIRSIF